MNIVSKDAGKEKLVNLRWFDLLIITVILFGNAIYISTTSFFSLSESMLGDPIDYSQSDFWYLLGTQFVFLMVALIYLRLRNYDFSQWHIRITPKAILLGAILFIGAALVFDLYFLLVGCLFPGLWGCDVTSDAWTSLSLWDTVMSADLSLILYALLNGFYEEIFFLGICLSVESKRIFPSFLYSLIVRYSFHTYQGNISAIAIGFILGTIFYLVYIRTRRRNLVPFFVAHSIADILGVGLISYILS